VALGPQVLALLYGPEYRSANKLLGILVAEVILSGATLVLSQAFMAMGRPGVITALQVTGLTLTIPLMILFVPRFGIVGAAVALLISTTGRFIFVLASFPIFLKVPMPQVFPKREDLLYMAEAVLKSIGVFGDKSLRAAEGMES
jgi:O-antigen/teichoic acid export membrane protein